MDLDTYPVAGQLLEGKYEIAELLGGGGMGAVFKAGHRLLQTPVALKFMAPHLMEIPGAIERFLNEGVAASRIDSNHVVKVLDVGKLPNGTPYLVMEYLDGIDLKALLAKREPNGFASIPRAVHFALQILRGLQVAHRAGIVHRDMKPANVFVMDRDGVPDFVKIVDFGISKVRIEGTELTRAHATLGTPLYMSLEQAMNAREVDGRSDLYAVAVILYELLAAKTPFGGPSMVLSQVMVQLATEEPPPISQQRRDLPPALAAVIMKGLAKEADDRHQAARDMAAELAPFADERSALVLERILGRMPSIPAGPSDAAPEVNIPRPPGLPSAGPSPSAPDVPPRRSISTLAAVSNSVPARTAVGSGAARRAVASRRARRMQWALAAALGAIALGVAALVTLLRDDPDPSSATAQPATTAAVASTAISTAIASPRPTVSTVPSAQPSSSSQSQTALPQPTATPPRPPKVPPSRPDPRVGTTPKSLGGISIED